MVIHMLPIWATTILFWTVYAQMTTFSVSQATKMNRNIGSFQIPSGSLTVFFVGSILAMVPFYDCIVAPICRRLTGHPQGLSPLQRIVVGLVLSILAMVAAALIEHRRLHEATVAWSGANVVVHDKLITKLKKLRIPCEERGQSRADGDARPFWSIYPSRFRLTHQTSFVRRHIGLSSTPGIRWIVAFFRQFFASVTKVDYLTMRHGFINAHLSPNTKFDFHKYITRSLEDDFKVVVGISFPLWTMAMVIMLLDVHGWYTLVWISFVPLIVLLVVGTKLEMIIMEMAHQIQNKTTVVTGAPIVEPSNSYFWFNNPKWILFLVQLTLFQNAFQMSNFLWIWYSFGLKSCYHHNFVLTIAKLVMGIGLQILCSYITFPLYALVTQMGSHMKKAIFEEHTAKAILKWREASKERRKHKSGNRGSQDFGSGYLSEESTPIGGSSPVYLLKNFKSNSNDVESVRENSPRFSPSDTEMSDMEMPTFKWRGEYDPRRCTAQAKEGNLETIGDFTFGSSSAGPIIQDAPDKV